MGSGLVLFWATNWELVALLDYADSIVEFMQLVVVSGTDKAPGEELEHQRLTRCRHQMDTEPGWTKEQGSLI